MIHVAHANESRMVISYVKRTRYKSRQISATDSSNGSKREREGVNRESERARRKTGQDASSFIRILFVACVWVCVSVCKGVCCTFMIRMYVYIHV